MMGTTASVLTQYPRTGLRTTKHVRKPRALIETQGIYKLTRRRDFTQSFQKGN